MNSFFSRIVNLFSKSSDLEGNRNELSTDSMSCFNFFLDVKKSSSVNPNRLLSSLSFQMFLLFSISTLIGIDMTSDTVWLHEMINNAKKWSSITINDVMVRQQQWPQQQTMVADGLEPVMVKINKYMY